MRYLSENADGSIALWACAPLRLLHVDGQSLTVSGVRRKAGQCWLYGPTDTGDSWEMAVGDEAFDVSDMADPPGYVIIWPNFEKDILEKLDPENAALVVRWREIKRGEIPEDRRFRGAWRDRGRVTVDMPAAREIHREHLRVLRAPKLAALDTAYMRADEARDQAAKTRIAVEKQALRDVTSDPAIEAAKTPEELIVPAMLTGAL